MSYSNTSSFFALIAFLNQRVIGMSTGHIRTAVERVA